MYEIKEQGSGDGRHHDGYCNDAGYAALVGVQTDGKTVR